MSTFHWEQKAKCAIAENKKLKDELRTNFSSTSLLRDENEKLKSEVIDLRFRLYHTKLRSFELMQDRDSWEDWKEE